MPSSLGIYIGEKIIKYAKVSKEKDIIKVDAFNVEFYDDLAAAVNKIINETSSQKLPISVNISNETYNYFDVFAMLTPKDIKKSVDIEFDTLCSEKKINRSSLETRYILMKSKENQETYKALYVAANKTDINRKTQVLSGYKTQSITPISTSVVNLLDINERENIAIVNIEEETQITLVSEGQISKIEVIPEGMGKILDQINKTENSMKKSYEICKNLTIYTQDVQSLGMDENEHLEDVMPTLYKIAQECKKIIENSLTSVNKVYITGLGTAINNIDLYFQEYIVNGKCEILKPYFLENASVRIPIKEYIEVNSAVALALDGLGFINKELNFTNSKMPNIIDTQKINELFKDKITFNGFTSTPLDKQEKLLLRGCFAAFVIVCGFIIAGSAVDKQIDSKKEQIAEVTNKTTSQLNLMDEDINKIKTRTNYYKTQIGSFNSLSESQDNTAKSRVIEKDAIPNLLNRVMFVIPQKVKVNSITNSQADHIVIEAQAEKYEQLGYFTAVLKTEGILTNIKSTSGLKNGSVVQVTIEGDLP